MNSSRKLNRLRNLLKTAKSVVVAYSGGVDSTFLLFMAKEALGPKNVLAVTARSETYPAHEFKFAKKMTDQLRVKHLAIKTKEFADPKFIRNPINRCYFCKLELFKKLKEIASAKRINAVLDGTNFDDLKDVRFGMQAARELGVKSPLKEAGITKDDIRKFSKQFGLPTWGKPSFACLASRIPYDTKITKDKLTSIERAENLLRRFGFSQIRVRHHGKIARIEVLPDEIKRLCSEVVRDKITQQFKRFGFKYITVDLAGYRTGSMNMAA